MLNTVESLEIDLFSLAKYVFYEKDKRLFSP